MVLTSEKLEQERFIVKLDPNGKGTHSVTRTRKVEGGLFKKSYYEEYEEEVEHDKYRMNPSQVERLPKDMHNMVFDDHELTERGYSRYHRAGFKHFFKYHDSKTYIRNFENTLSDYFKKHNISKDDIISIEYCKDDCKLTGAYITWDKH